MPRTHAHVIQAGSLVARYAFEKNSGRAHETSLAHAFVKLYWSKLGLSAGTVEYNNSLEH